MKEMTNGEFEQFIHKVRMMRTAQKEYFQQRSKAALERSKRLEKEVDEAVQNILYPQQKLF